MIVAILAKDGLCGGVVENPNYRAYRRGRENEPGGIGTVTIGFPSVGMGSSLPEARTSLKGRRSAVQRKK